MTTVTCGSRGCRNRTRNPAGRCYLHEGAAVSHPATPLPAATAATSYGVGDIEALDPYIRQEIESAFEESDSISVLSGDAGAAAIVAVEHIRFREDSEAEGVDTYWLRLADNRVAVLQHWSNDFGSTKDITVGSAAEIADLYPLDLE